MILLSSSGPYVVGVGDAVSVGCVDPVSAVAESVGGLETGGADTADEAGTVAASVWDGEGSVFGDADDFARVVCPHPTRRIKATPPARTSRLLQLTVNASPRGY